MKIFKLFASVILALTPVTLFSQTGEFYSFKVKTLEGEDFDLEIGRASCRERV